MNLRTRNSPCSCGSGKRFKHCCGAPSEISDPDDVISDEELLAALKAADDRNLAKGMPPGARGLMNVGDALEAFGISSFVMGPGAPVIVKRAERIGRMLFVPKDRQAGGIHLGAFLFRDMFCQLYVPIVFGSAAVDFWKLLDLTDVQKKWLSEDAEASSRFIDQAADLLDFGYGWQEFGHGRKIDNRSRDYIWRAHTQLEAAAATATGAFDFRGTLQSSLLGTELALKAGLAAHGVPDSALRSRALGHDLVALATRLASLEPDFDLPRVQRVLAGFPDFVASRYDTPPPGRIETGHILMGAQYIASEVTRRFSDRDCRKSQSWEQPRTYPA